MFARPQKNPHRHFFALLWIVFALAAGAQAATFTAATDGNWNSAATWTVSGVDGDGIPDADDTVTIPNLRVVTVTSAQGAHILTVSTGGTLTLNAGSSVTLDGTASSFFTNAGTTNGTGTIRTTPGTGTTGINIDGTFTAALEIGAGTTNASSSTIGGPIAIVNGATLATSNQPVTHTGDLTINAGGTLTSPNGSFSFSGANLVNNGTMAMTGTFNLNGGAQNLSGTGVITGNPAILNGTTLTLTSNFTFGNGNVTSTGITINTGGTIAVGSNTLTINGGGISGAGATSGSGSINLQGTSSISSGSLWVAPVVIAGGTTNGLGTFGGPITVSNGATMNIANQTVTVNGNLTINGSLISSSSNGTFNANGTNIVNNGTVTGIAFRFGGGPSQTFSGNGTLVGSVTVFGGTTVTLTSNITLGDGIAASTLAVNTGGTLAVGGFTLTLNGVAVSGAGAFTSTTAGLIRTQGTSSISIGAAFTGSLEINSGTTNVAGTAGGSVTILSGAVMNITNQTVTVNGDLTIGGSLISSSSNGTFNAAGANVVNNGSVTGIAFRFSGTSQNLSGTGSISSGVTIFSGSTVTLGSDHQLATLVVNTGGTLNTAAFTLSLNGSGTPLSGAGTIANVNITYNGTAAQTVQATNVTYNRVGINNAAGVTLSTAETVNQRLLLLNGQFNNGVNLSLAAGATIERNNGTLQTAPTLLGNVNLVYSGSAVVTTGIEFPTSTTVVNDLSVTKVGAANTVTLDASRTVNGALTLTTGRLLTGAFNIIIGPVGTASGTANGYVIGSIRKTVAGPGSTVYPVGTAAGYSPATINIDSGSGSFTVTAANGVIGGLAAAKALNRYWSLSQSGITQADITFAYQQSDVPGPANEPGFDFFRDGGGGTFFDPSSLDTGNNIATLNNVTQFSDWTLYDPTPNPDTTVSSTADAGPGTLRQAILDANALAGADTIVFNGTFGSAQTILLTSGEMLVSDELTITGPGANLLTISGGNSSRIFSIASGETATFSGFRMTAGNGIGGTDAGSGGAIYSLGNLDLTNVAIDANTASVSGGGIFSSGGTLDVTGSTISRNSAVADGGGIHINSTTATVHNSTISGNSATASGGGINIVSGPVTITYSTIANNGAGVNGGGVNGASTAGNTIIADNTATGSGPDYNGTLTSQGHMLLGNTSGATIAGTTTGNITAAPQLDQLTNNGGPTETHRLQLTSPAVDAADPITFPPTDQRGMPRPVDGNATGGARADIGAFELMITTAADVIISGRILASNGRPISGALVELNSAKGEPLSARTNTFGYFRFKEVEVGESYVMTVSARGFNFAPLFLSVNDNIDGLIITPTGRR